jgi:hypothetical protein
MDMYRVIAAVIMAAVCCSFSVASEVSERKIRIIDRIVKGEFYRVMNPGRRSQKSVYKSVNDANIKKNIEAKVRKQVTPFETKAKQVGVSSKVRAEISRKIAKRFPYKNQAEIAMGALKEAELAYPLVQKGDDVNIRYYRAGVAVTVSGKVQSVRDNGRVYEVDNVLVRVDDIIPSDRQYFDPEINGRLRQKFITDFRDPKKFAKFKRDYITFVNAEELEKVEVNEKNGYIFFQNRWVTAKYVTDQLFNRYKKLTVERHKSDLKYLHQKKEAAPAKKK